MRKYRYLTFADRKQISAWYQSNDRAADIAERLGMSVKTIYLELKRGEETGESGTVILKRRTVSRADLDNIGGICEI